MLGTVHTADVGGVEMLVGLLPSNCFEIPPGIVWPLFLAETAKTRPKRNAERSSLTASSPQNDGMGSVDSHSISICNFG